MSYSITITGNTPDELYASVAAFLDRPVLVSAASGQTRIGVTVSDDGKLKAALEDLDSSETDDNTAPSADAPGFDKAGTPWDERIHSSSKAFNADGTWRKRRNLSDVTYNIVMAELAERTAGTQPQVPASPVAAVAPPVPAVPETVGVPVPPVVHVESTQAPAPAAAVPTAPSAIPVPVPAPPVLAAPVAPAPAAPVPVPATAPVVEPTPVPQAVGMEFKVFMPLLAQAMKPGGRFSEERLTKEFLPAWGLTSITQLATDPVKVEQFYMWLKAADLID